MQINNGQASILYSRCINCGKCVKSCPQNAKIVVDHKINLLDILDNNKNVIACLAPSFPASFYPFSYKKVLGGLKKLGFSQVWEVAVGAEELSKQIDEFLKKNNDKTYISSSCPAFVAMVEKHYPELIGHLLPFVSPMIATAKIIREKFKKEDIKLVFIGPCIAKMAEVLEPQFENIIDIAITFDKIKQIFVETEIDLAQVEECNFDGFSSKNGRLFPLPVGLLNNLTTIEKFNKNQYISIHNEKECIQMLDYISKGKMSAKLVDVLMCNGCIEGPKMDSDLNYYEKMNIIYDFNDSKPIEEMNLNIDVDMKRNYINRRTILPYPSEDEIQKVLNLTDKFTKEDELNCDACGYGTCRNKAIAVLQGIAEVDMCLPYLLCKKTNLFEALTEQYNEISILRDQLEATIESSYDGIVLTDGTGKILMSNSSWLKMVGYNKDYDGKLVQEMEDMGIIFPSATLLALKEKRRISFIQNAMKGKKYLATGTPIFDESGNIKMVVTNIRDIDELYKLKKKIEETMRLGEYHSQETKETNSLNIKNDNIVANSSEFGTVLQTASNVSGVESTVLLFGESGVGKEVIAKFIHKLSKRSHKPLITINCGSIPENLIESELFGYETGAFTGSQKNGKSGLIELANEGTLFLDEIGELSLNLQVKLLRVIQERKLMRLGGISEKNVDVRIITATNRNLHKMVLDGEFRADLYYRLNVVPIEIPPLRKRKADIIPLCHHFIKIFNDKYDCNKEITAAVEEILKSYSWPGNVRELENLMERLIVTTYHNVIDENDLPQFLFEDTGDMNAKIKIDGILKIKEAQEILEKELIKKAYRKCKSTYKMAKLLGVNQSTVVRKMHKYLKNNALLHD